MVEKTTYTLAEAADLLSCHKETLRRAIKSGSLRAAKIGKEYRISKADLEDFWAVRGGGALFDDSPRPLNPPEQMKKKKPVGPEQLKLPT